MLDPQLTCPEGLVFDQEQHTYLLDGRPVPSVSKLTHVVCPDLYAMIAEDVLMRAARRGQNRHAMIALDVRDQLDIGALGDSMLEAWSAWDDFRSMVRLEVEHSERCVASRKHWFAGTLDIAGVLTYNGTRGKWIIDAKFTSAKPDLVDIQLAAYKMAAAESLPGYQNARRGCLWIKDGKAKFFEYTNRMDNAAIIAARTILNRRETL